MDEYPAYKILATGEIILKQSTRLDMKVNEHLDKIEQIWKKEQEKKKTMFNSDVFSFINYYKSNNKIVVEGKFVEYKVILAERIDQTLQLGIHQIGVSGITIISTEESHHVLFSTRSDNVTEYPGYLEL